MTEVTAVSAAQRNRIVQDALRLRDQQRDDVATSRARLLAEVRQRADIIEQQVQIDTQRLRDRRDDIQFETDQDDEVREQIRVLDTIANDTLFQRNQDNIIEELNAARDDREGLEALLLRDLEGQRNDIAELQAAEQRREDIRAAINDREDRLIERRAAERDEEIRQQIDLRVSLDRINNPPDRQPSDTERGGVLDVRA
ncbi:MAG: hypothetical protein OXR84_03435 [Magnetovibrio sp.]|nr:hypothetical protein [Magnetovibrio sp.]